MALEIYERVEQFMEKSDRCQVQCNKFWLVCNERGLHGAGMWKIISIDNIYGSGERMNFWRDIDGGALYIKFLDIFTIAQNKEVSVRDAYSGPPG